MKKSDKRTVVYLAVNAVNGGEYIGITNGTLAHRRRQHQWDAANGRGYCQKFSAALRKYGNDSFEWSVLAEFDQREDAVAREIEEIALRRPRYNITPGGPGVIIPHTKEWNAKISAAHKGKKMSPEAVRNRRNSITPEIQARITQKMKDRGAPHWAIAASVAARSKPVICIETGTVFPKARVAAMAHGLKPGHVHDCIKHARKSGIAGVSFRHALPHEVGMENVRG